MIFLKLQFKLQNAPDPRPGTAKNPQYEYKPSRTCLTPTSRYGENLDTSRCSRCAKPDASRCSCSRNPTTGRRGDENAFCPSYLDTIWLFLRFKLYIFGIFSVYFWYIWGYIYPPLSYPQKGGLWSERGG